MRPRPQMFLVAPLLLCGLRAARAQSIPAPPATAPADVKIALTTTVEDGKKELLATVSRHGKPVQNAIVVFGARRTFGILTLGHDQTLDDGTAAVAFPVNLPAAANGELQLVARITAPPAVAGAHTELALKTGIAPVPPEQPFGRALWSPHAPVSLIVAIVLLLAGAWGAYLFVVVQLIAIKKGASG